MLGDAAAIAAVDMGVSRDAPTIQAGFTDHLQGDAQLPRERFARGHIYSH